MMFMFYLICELDNHDRIPDPKKSNEEDCNQDVERIRRAAHLFVNIFLKPNQPCFTQYFLNGQPPTGLRTANLHNMRYICQQRLTPEVTHYASMYDEGGGTPVYSAYTLHAGNVNFQAQAVARWIQTPGNVFTCTKIQNRMRSEVVSLLII